ncbi:peptidase S1 [Maricaulis sp. CAU 1757]
MMKFTLAASAALVAIAGTALAQDYTQAPTFGSANLSAGFTPDPYAVNITAGGNIDASQWGNGCAGMVANAPDFRLQYSAGSYPLSIGAISDADTTLIINGPDGQWYCDDDSGGDLDPLLTWGNPPSGQYDIWIGTYGSGSDLAPATIIISELGG